MSILGAFFRRSGKQYQGPSNTPDPVAHKYIEPKVREGHWGTSQRPHLIGYDPGYAVTGCRVSGLGPDPSDDPNKPRPPGMIEWEQMGFGTFNVGPRYTGKLSGTTV